MKDQIPLLLKKAYGDVPMEVFDAYSHPQPPPETIGDGNSDGNATLHRSKGLLFLQSLSVRFGFNRSM